LQESVTKPELAIWVIPCLRDARTLVDKEGAFCALQQRLAAFRWETLQEQANAWASNALMLFAVVVLKALGARLRQDETALAYATQELFYSLTWAMAVQRGVLIEGGNSYYDQVQEAAGKDSAWTRAHRLILCLEPFPDQLSPVQARGNAALRLYQETAWLLRDALLPQDREVIDRTLQIIEEASLATG
jgi:hypothetical protein